MKEPKNKATHPWKKALKSNVTVRVSPKAIDVHVDSEELHDITKKSGRPYLWLASERPVEVADWCDPPPPVFKDCPPPKKKLPPESFEARMEVFKWSEVGVVRVVSTELFNFLEQAKQRTGAQPRWKVRRTGDDS